MRSLSSGKDQREVWKSCVCELLVREGDLGEHITSSSRCVEVLPREVGAGRTVVGSRALLSTASRLAASSIS